jgi:cysteate synthase
MSQVIKSVRRCLGVTYSKSEDNLPLEQRPNLTTEDNPPQHYLLSCPTCGFTSEDDGYKLECGSCLSSSFLVSQYRAKEFSISAEENGIYRYRSWLPVRRSLAGSSCTLTYQSERLSTFTGLRNLWIAFNGYWPERDARLLSGTFKELEAYCVLGRIPATNEKVIIVASAGNTAAAFARICSRNGTRCLIIVPEIGLMQMRFEQPIASCVKIVAITGTGDYSDAIRLGNHVAKIPGFSPEGGAKNVARRDGLGTVLLNVFETIGRLPDYYFQAIGSGTGAIAVHESARRLSCGQGPFPRLWLSQNLPFAPIYNAWKSGARDWPHLPEKDAKRQISQIRAQVLANRFPPYATRGGLYDVLVESKGNVIAVTNEQAISAAKLFEKSEGIDIAPAAAVAFASLLTSVEDRLIPPNATVLLNVTGGGQLRRFENGASIQLEADLSIDPADIDGARSLNEITKLFEGTTNLY